MQRGIILYGSTALAVVMAAAPAYAQTAQQESQRVEEIVVTGSHLRQSDFKSPIPVKTIEKEDFDESGYSDLAQALTDIPGVDTDINLSNNQNSTTENGLSTVELRGAGRNRTLTLIDGLRTVSDSGSGNTVNLATLPTFFIDRVQVSTGGASAAYGSDAIAGVVNITTENNFEGVKARAVASATADGGGSSTEYSIGAGHKFLDNRLYLMGAVTYQNQDALMGSDRDWALKQVSYSSTTNLLTSPNLSTTIPGGKFLSNKFFYDANGLETNFVSTANGFDTRPTMTLTAPRQTWASAFKARYDITDKLRLTGALLYSHIDTFAPRPPVQISSSDTYGVLDELTLGRIPLTNPLIPAAIRAAAPATGVDFTRRLMELGTLGARNTRDTTRGWVGLQGEAWGDWNWDLTYSYGRSQQDQVRQNGFNYAKVKLALDATTINGQIVCADATARAAGCVPLNLFGVNSITPAMADYIRDSAWYRAVNLQNRIAGNLVGSPFSLPAGEVQFATGFEARRDTLTTTSDNVGSQGLSYWQYAAAYKGKIEATEAYAETSVPLVRDKPLVDRLSIDGAFRIAHYNLSGVGTTHSYRLGAQWQPVEGLNFRGTYSRAERAPSMTELYSPPRGNIDSVTDICSGITATTAGAVAQGCRAVPGIAAAIAANGVFKQSSTDVSVPNSGNADLTQETAHTLTAGFVLNPSFFKGFQASVDYWDLKIDNVIASSSTSDTLYLCYALPAGEADAYCGRISRNADGQLARILNQVENQDQMRRRGVDVAASYRFDLRSLNVPGRFNLDLKYSRALEVSRRYHTSTGVISTDGLGEIGDAKDTARGSITWSTPRLMLKWTTAYIGPSIDDNDLIATFQSRGIANPMFLHVPSFTRHDFSVRLVPSQSNPNLRLFGTIRNIFNTEGPFLPTGTSSGSSNNYNSVYDVAGRTFSLGLQVQY